MNDLMEFLTSTEIIVVYIVVAVACLLCFIIYLLDKNYYKRKQKQNTKELNKLVESITEEIKIDNANNENSDEVFYEKPVLEKLDNNVIESEHVVVTPTNDSEATIQPIVTEKIDTSVIENDDSNLENLISEISKREEVLEEVKDANLKYTDIEPNQTEAQAELQKLTEALEQAEEETKNIDLTEFEEEQEQNAIISIDELMAKTKVMYENNELEKFNDEGNEPISLKDLEAAMATTTKKSVGVEKIEPVVSKEKIESVQERLVLDDFNNVKIEEEIIKPKKFKSSPVISPVYGIEKDTGSKSATELELENTANYDKLDEEIKKTNEFLMTLRELQKKLD